MRVLVFGAGAIGSLVGGLLSIENEVTLVARPAHADAIRRDGLRISGLTTLVAHPSVTTEVPRADFDVIFVTTKAYDTSSAVAALHPFWRRATFVSLQNGLGNAEALAASVARVLAGTTSHGVTLLGPGEIRHAGIGDTIVGAVQGANRDAAERLADAMTRAGLATSVTDEIARELWTKAAVNGAINPLTAVLRRANGALVADPDLRALVVTLVREGALAAGDAGVDVDAERLARLAVEVATKTADNRSSMLQDIERGRRTEIDAISGALVRAAAARGHRLPYTETICALVQGLERAGIPGKAI